MTPAAGEQLAWSWLGPRPRRARRRHSAARRPPPSRPVAEQLRLRLPLPSPLRVPLDELALGWLHRLGRRQARGYEVRPRRRSDCSLVPRPCPFAGCRHHLAIDVVGTAIVRHPLATEDLEDSCSLDVADRTAATGEPLSLYAVARLLGRRKETIVHENRDAIRALRQALGDP